MCLTEKVYRVLAELLSNEYYEVKVVKVDDIR